MGWLFLGLGLAALTAFGISLAASNNFIAGLPAHAAPYGPTLIELGRKWQIDPRLLYGVFQTESRFGLALIPPGPGGKGDGGHGHGIAQIDDRTWGQWLMTHNWQDPIINMDKGASILADGMKRFPGNLRAAISAYNAGPGRVRKAIEEGRDPGSVTTHAGGRSYPDNVIRHMTAAFPNAGVELRLERPQPVS